MPAIPEPDTTDQIYLRSPLGGPVEIPPIRLRRGYSRWVPALEYARERCQITQATRNPTESLTNIGAATLLSSAMAVEGFREPSGLVPELRALSWTQKGRKPL
jgi:hypothetical protein